MEWASVSTAFWRYPRFSWWKVRDPISACEEFFQINYEETPEEAQARFDPWLEDAIVRGLDLWQRTLI